MYNASHIIVYTNGPIITPENENMTAKIHLAFIIVGILTFQTVNSEYALYECPFGWEEFEDHCYRFVKDPPQDIGQALVQCSYDGATGISISSNQEHIFVVNTLNTIDVGQIKLQWWTSGRRQERDSAEFYWMGDGTKVESFVYWHNDSIPQQMNKDYIQYYFDGYDWAWILLEGTIHQKSAYICEISKDDIYMISEGDRGPDYGIVDNIDPELIPRGPHITIQPEDTIHEPNDILGYNFLDCYADAYPPATYEWRRERAGQNITINPSEDKRYTLINGRLIIHDPSAETQDDGKYQCIVKQDFGIINSNMISMSFGYLQDFPKSPRAPVEAISYQWASIECSPPAHFPDVLYTWYKNDIYNFIRPEFKPYIFISHDGRLYFSEVTTDDIGNYYCLVYKPGQALAEGKVSMPTELRITEGSPGEYEPQIGSSFPLVYPNSQKVGDTVRLECWASGTSLENNLVYNWDKIEVLSDGTYNRLPLPPQSRLADHNRVLTIPDINIYDAGKYMCTVQRINGQSTNKSVDIVLQARPAFTVELKDQFVDIGARLVQWRCAASGDPNPNYYWLKNGQHFNNDTIPPEDQSRISVMNNVVNIDGLNDRDDGMYQCVAENMHGTRYSTGELRVLAFGPNFQKYPLLPNQFATERGNTTLFCRPEAAPYPEYEAILWYKDNSPLNPGEDEGSRIRKMPNGNLFISNLQTNDHGRYRCHVTNPYGEAETIGNLTVLATTTITQPPIDTNINVNSSAFLHCIASYSPEQDVTYVWYHGDMLIDFELVFRLGENKYQIWFNPHYKRGNGIYNGGLYIMDAQHEHSGLYTCVVESSSGSMTRDCNVFINGPPSEPAGVYTDDTTVTTLSIIVEWKAAGSNGATIISYVIEGFNYWEGFWKILITNVKATPDEYGKMSYNITNLQSFSTYRLRMRAENVLGTSPPSMPTGEFTTLGRVPDRYPDEVGGGGGKVGDLVITWKPLPDWEHNGNGFGYRVFLKEAGDEDWEEDDIRVYGNVGRFVYLVMETNFYRMYQVAVQAFNEFGDGPQSPTVIIRSAMGLPNIIAKNVLAQPHNATACIVHWHPVEDDKENIRGKLGGYRISYWKECCEEEEGAPRVTITGQADQGLVIGLYPNTPYFFDVMVWNEAGNGPKSQYFIQRTLRKAPIDMPVEVQLERRSSTSIYAIWRGISTAQQEEPLEGYRVRIWSDGEHLKHGHDFEAERETELFIDGLKSRVMYKLRVFGYSRGGMGTMSSPALRFMLGGSKQVAASTVLIIMSLSITRWLSLYS